MNENKQENIGKKNDSGKPMWNLIPWVAQAEVVKVLTFGAGKYGEENWRLVPESKARYISASFRHIIAWVMGEKNDQESGCHHLAHAICCLLFLAEKDMAGEDDE